MKARDKWQLADSHIMTMSEVELRATLLGLNNVIPETVLDEIERTLTVSRAAGVAQSA